MGFTYLFKAATVFVKKSQSIVVCYISYFWDFGYILHGICLSF